MILGGSAGPSYIGSGVGCRFGVTASSSPDLLGNHLLERQLGGGEILAV